MVWHCTNAFEEGKKCVDGVCGKCKMDHGGNGHSCNICNQEIDDYKMEDNQGSHKCTRMFDPTTWS